MNLVEINILKDKLVDYIIPFLDDLRDSKKEVNTICKSFAVTTNDEIECVKLALNEICSSNQDITGRVDVFDDLQFNIARVNPVKGVVLLLFLDKNKDRFNHPDINRFYVEYPEFYTGVFEERNGDDTNKFIGWLLATILSVKEENLPFGYVKTRSIDGICNDFIPDVVDKVEREGLKCKAIEHIVSDDEEYVYFFIYEAKSEEMNKQIEVLERRGTIRLVK